MSVCIFIYEIRRSKSPFWLQLGSRETPPTSHPETEVKRCLRCNQRQVVRAAWVRCESSTPWRDPRRDELARSCRRRAQPFLPNHCCSEYNRVCLSGPLRSSSREGATRSVQAARWARTRNCSRSSNLAQFHWEQLSSKVQPHCSLRGSEAEPTTSSWYSSFRGLEKSLAPVRLRRAGEHSQINGVLPIGLRRPLGLNGGEEKSDSPFVSTPRPPTWSAQVCKSFSEPVGSPERICVYRDTVYINFWIVTMTTAINMVLEFQMFYFGQGFLDCNNRSLL